MKWAPDEGHDDVVYVYLLTNDINGKRYVGITWNPIKRWKEHIGSDAGVGRAFSKYGPENFTKDILAVSNRKGALELEAHYCKLYDCLAPNGYNLVAGGHGRTHTSDETRDKQSIALKGKKKSQEHRDNISASGKGRKRGPSFKKGIPLSQETRDKMSSAHKGKKKSQEHRDKQSIALKGKPWSQARRDAAGKKKLNN